MDKTDLMAALGDIEYDLIGEIMHAENYEEAETYAWKFEGIRAAQEIVAQAMREEAGRFATANENRLRWENVAVNSKILVRNHEGDPWLRRHFAYYYNGNVYAYADGKTSITNDGEFAEKWDYAKLVGDDDAPYTNPAEAAHDGCFGCKHEIKSSDEWPCSDCEGAHTIADRWEPKSEKGEEN